jgi:Spy/CpxP family protein refolding chaperone
MKHTILSLTLAVSALAGPDQWLQSGLIKPEIIQRIKPELQLTTEQETQMTTLMSEARAKADPLEVKLKEQQQTLQDLLRQPGATADSASAQLTQVLESEGAIKQLQLRTLISLRDLLTPEQQKKALTLGLHQAAKTSDLESAVTTKANRLKTAVEALGEPPTRAMKARGAEIEQLIKNADWAAADAALDKLIIDSQVNEAADFDKEIDFSSYGPGDTNLDSLKERFEAVKVGAQDIISIPLLNQFLKAKAAFESAKASEDAVAVGRVLSWVEHQLAKK